MGITKDNDLADPGHMSFYGNMKANKEADPLFIILASKLTMQELLNSSSDHDGEK